ncbi:leucyl aminopeptidase family protein [Kibdelosporangium philippinense]|uniref:Probable cytosol aminopeptidase n=1 Tax=Kibdelosporangium philippinense TaxID=211113 RepID=A0ABS8ZPR8_9PSEU|nr:leucyl aminopeptidase family protein [Kibdelosporangium philippinense]MCE7008463.1 leucyl aminopeptidase family protein [Kibdelosporangium philippinense]
MRTPVPSLPSPMPEFEVAATPRRGIPVAVLAYSGDSPALGPGGADLSADWASTVGLTGKAGEVHAVADGRWVLGIGGATAAEWRKAGASLVRALEARASDDADAGRRVLKAVQLTLPPSVSDDHVAAFVLGAALGGYRYKVSSTQKPRLKTVRLVTEEELRPAVDRALAIALGTTATRDMGNTPSNVKDPAWLASRAVKLAAQLPGLTVDVRDEKWLAAEGFGGLLAVGGGSASPPRFVELSWRPAKPVGPHIAYVGKGITFDTGGISIKPADGMHLMRTDMCGGASVIAALVTIARLGLPVRVTGLVPIAENHVSGSSYRPGDIVKHYDGQTTEVSNTDAEGRMVLADAMGYAIRRVKPDLMVDVATLTGAMKVALGVRTGGLFATDDDLAARIIDAGTRSGESWWRMPLLAELEDEVVSDIADWRQCPPGPGGITAALFLEKFTDGIPWAHMDIAGPARAEKVYDEVVPGATGFSTRTLVELVSSYIS